MLTNHLQTIYPKKQFSSYDKDLANQFGFIHLLAFCIITENIWEKQPFVFSIWIPISLHVFGILSTFMILILPDTQDHDYVTDFTIKLRKFKEEY